MNVTSANNGPSHSDFDGAQLISSHIWKLTARNLAKKQENRKSSPHRLNSLLMGDILENRSSLMLLDSCEQSDSEMSWPSFDTREVQCDFELDHIVTELPKTEI